MTKITVLGEPEKRTVKRAIEIKKVLRTHGVMEDYTSRIRAYDNCILLCKNYGCGGLDLFMVYDNDSPHTNSLTTNLFLGHWNDGVFL